MSNSAFKYLLNRPTIDWTCALRSLPTLSDSFFNEEEETVTEEEDYLNRSLLKLNANDSNHKHSSSSQENGFKRM